MEGAIDELTHLLAMTRLDAQESGDDGRRDAGPEVLHVVEGPTADLRVEEVGAEFPNFAFQHSHPARCERLGHQTTEAGVIGGIGENHHAADDVGTHDLEHGAMRGAERPGVAVGGVDVNEAAESVEIVRRVVIDGRLVPQETPHRVRVLLVLLADGIPRQRALGPGRAQDVSHSLMPPRMPALLSMIVMRSSVSPNSSRSTRRAFPPPM